MKHHDSSITTNATAPLTCLLRSILLALLSVLVSCEPKPDFGILMDAPFPGTKLSGPLVINGKYASGHSTLSWIDVELIRISDNLSWHSNGSGWGSSITLVTTLNTAEEKWQCSAALPSGADLPDGWYRATAYAHYTGHAAETAETVFSVGFAAPPVAPALYGWGMNLSGQLGSGDFDGTAHPIPVHTRGALDGKIVAAVAAGGSQTLALTSEKKVYAWGSLAIGAGPLVTQISFPIGVDTSGVLATKQIVSIAAGDQHSLAADKDGAVYAWGRNTSGELGNNTTGGEAAAPLQVTGFPNGTQVVQVAAGLSFSAALTSTGEVYTWGRNDSGQLGNGSAINDFAHSAVPVMVTGLAGKFISAISVSANHVLARTSQGEVYAWGDNSGHQLGNHSGTDSNVPVLIGGILAGKTVTAVSAGRLHSMALADGKVYAWGSAQSGRLGTTTQIEHHGTVVEPGDWTSYPIELGDALTGKTVVRISAGDNSFAVTQDNQIYGWGANLNNELPGGPSISASVPALLNFSDALSGGRVVMDFDMRHAHGMVLTGFPVVLAPEIEVEAQGAELTDGGSLNFGTVGQGSNNPIYITVRNRGTADLKDLNLSITGTGASEYSGHYVSGPISPNGETGFYLFFNPNGTGASTATMQIFSNDADESPFDVTLTGTSYPVGKVDLPFDPQMDGNPDAISVQPDGKVIVGGSFFNIGTTPRNRCARLDATTGAADSFNPDVDSYISCSLVLPDGKAMIGGGFSVVGPEARNKLARLNADGTLDTTYNAQLSGSFGVTGMALQSDGKLIVVGNISRPGQNYIVRLNPDGSRDASFAPVLNSPPRGVAVRSDGQVLIWGQFTTVNGAACTNVALLNGTDGTTDPLYNNPLITFSGIQIDAAALQRDGKIVVGGQVQSVNGTPINGMCRLKADGSLDASFDPNVDGRVNSIALQADGSMIICGQFTHVGGQPRNRIAKISANGSLDFYFDPGSGGAMNAVMLQADGKVLCTPFGSIAGESRTNFARLNNGVATQSLRLDNGVIVWERGGSSPETNLVTFEVSGDLGSTWTDLGPATRVTFPNPGWQLTGATLPATGYIRARAYPQGARYNGSSSQMITTVTFGTPPDIEVTENAVPFPQHSARRDFGVVATGSAASTAILTIQNTGGTTLTGLEGITINGAAKSNFELGRPSSFTLAPGATTTMTVTYRPKTTGTHIAFLSIPNNSWYQSNYQIMLKGIGGMPFTTVKLQKTGDSATPDNAPSGLNSGESLLSAFATGTTETSTDGNGTSITPPAGGGGFAPFANGEANDGPPSGETFLFHYRRNKLALADIVYQVEWSDTLAENDWHTEGVTEQIDSDDDTIQQITATVPVGTSGHRFVRLKMTRP